MFSSPDLGVNFVARITTMTVEIYLFIRDSHHVLHSSSVILVYGLIYSFDCEWHFNVHNDKCEVAASERLSVVDNNLCFLNSQC